jgi:hypothetical protein
MDAQPLDILMTLRPADILPLTWQQDGTRLVITDALWNAMVAGVTARAHAVLEDAGCTGQVRITRTDRGPMVYGVRRDGPPRLHGALTAVLHRDDIVPSVSLRSLLDRPLTSSWYRDQWRGLGEAVRRARGITPCVRQWVTRTVTTVCQQKVSRTMLYGTVDEMRVVQQTVLGLEASGYQWFGHDLLMSWSDEARAQDLRDATPETWSERLHAMLRGPSRLEAKALEVIRDPVWVARVLPTDDAIAEALLTLPPAARLGIIRALGQRAPASPVATVPTPAATVPLAELARRPALRTAGLQRQLR